MKRVTVGSIALLVFGMCVYITVAQPPGDRGRRQGRLGPGNSGPPRLPLMTALDVNNDGEISAAEMKDAMSAFTKLDRNHDDKLARDEIGPIFRRFGGGPGRSQSPGQNKAASGDGEELVFGGEPLAQNDAEKKTLSILDDLDQNQRRGMMNVPLEDGRLLRLLTETIGAKTVVEIGTSNGYSGIWFCLALRKTGGKLITHEIDAHRASLAREHFQQAGVEDIVTLVEGDAHEEVLKLKGPIDLLFLDADKEGYIDYLNKLLPLVRPGGLIVAHNMNVRQADPRFVKAVTTNPDLETLFLHMEHMGVAVSLKKR